MQTTTAKLFTRVLADADVRVVAGIPGHTTFAFADALLDEKRITPITLRHEAVGTFAADAYFRVSGSLMAVTTHSLAGTSNAMAGIGNAYADSSAMLVIAGEEARESLGRGAYQELSRSMDGDVAQLLRHVTKRSWVCHTPLQIVEQTIRAIKTATVGRPGPVSLHVFYDLWEAVIDLPEWPQLEGLLPARGESRPTRESVVTASDVLRHASRPLIIAGNGVNLGRAQAELLALAEASQVPVATTVTGKGAFPEDHHLSVGVVGWVGTSCANWAAQNADVILAIGARMTETTTSSWQPNGTFDPSRSVLIQSDIDPIEVGNVFPVAASLIGDAKATCGDLEEALAGWKTDASWLSGVKSAKDEWSEVSAAALTQTSEPLSVGPVIANLRALSSGQPLNIVADVGKHHKWLAQQFEARSGDMVISSMGAGTMGIGPCGALGAALGRPTAKTIAWVGDGGMTMSLPVLPTVAENRLPILFIVIDDGSYGAVVNAQMNRYKRTNFAEFHGNGVNPDYWLDIASVANACGIPARRVENPDELESAMKWGLESSEPALIDIVVDQNSVAPSGGGFKIGNIWEHPIFPWTAPDSGE